MEALAAYGSRVLVFRSVSALRAEVRGDFSDWQPRALEPTPDGGWQIPWTAGAGTFRINIRLDDGPWIAPPGLPSFADEFGGIDIVAAPVEPLTFLFFNSVASTLVVGGITRLTLSGLSIVNWDPLFGVIPPLTDAAAMQLAAGYLLWRSGWLAPAFVIAVVVGSITCDVTVRLRVGRGAG